MKKIETLRQIPDEKLEEAIRSGDAYELTPGEHYVDTSDGRESMRRRLYGIAKKCGLRVKTASPYDNLRFQGEDHKVPSSQGRGDPAHRVQGEHISDDEIV